MRERSWGGMLVWTIAIAACGGAQDGDVATVEVEPPPLEAERGKVEPGRTEQAAEPRQAEVGVEQLKQMEPARRYLDARRNLQRPMEFLGGPLRVTVIQRQGGVHVALPGIRELDENVFGTPDLPRAWGGTPIVTGVPPQMRGREGGRYTSIRQPSPFGDEAVVLPNGNLEVTLTDITATDAATTRDRAQGPGR